MGKKSDAMTEYFNDNERFAGLFNGSFFQGEAVVKPQELKEGSEVYIDDYVKFVLKEDKTAKKNAVRHGDKEADVGKQVDCESDGALGAPESEVTQKVSITIKDDTIPRTRDVKKRLDSGGTLRVLAIEDQNLVDFTMPWRTMNYDNLEYKRQLNVMKKWNKQEGNLITDSERMSGIRKQDRLTPAFTICLYVILGGDVIVAKREKNYDEDGMCTGLRGIIEDSKNEGRNEERAAAIQVLVETCQALGATIEAVATQLATRYQLTQENARKYVNSYWK